MTKIRTEAFDVMQNFYRAVHDPLIRCTMHFSGRVKPDILARAVNLSIPAVPQIVCGFSEKSHGWVPGGFTADDMIHIVQGGEDAMKKLQLTPLDFEHGPQLGLFLAQGEQDDALCVTISHLVADGAGLKQYLYLLAELYSRCEADSGYHTPAQPGDRSLGQLLRGYRFGERMKILSAEVKGLKQDPSMYPPLRGDRNRPFLVRTVLEAPAFSSVVSYGEQRGASVNDMLMTAFARAMAHWTGNSHVAFPCPVDIRKYLREPERCGVCNLTSNYICDAEIRPGEPFEETLRGISAQMKAQKGSTACLKGPALLRPLSRVLPYPVFHSLFSKLFTIPVVSYTNIGVLDEKRLAFGTAQLNDAFLSTAVKYAPYFQLSVSTWRGTCSLCSSFHGTPEDESAAASFLEQVRGELLSAAGE